MQRTINLPNGYKIEVNKEGISHVGRSIFRDFDNSQVVLKIIDSSGQVTKRLPIPASVVKEVAGLMSAN